MSRALSKRKTETLYCSKKALTSASTRRKQHGRGVYRKSHLSWGRDEKKEDQDRTRDASPGLRVMVPNAAGERKTAGSSAELGKREGDEISRRGEGGRRWAGAGLSEKSH